MPPDLFLELEKHGADMKVTKFKVNHRYDPAAHSFPDGQEVYIECDRIVTLNIELFIRHGRSLMLRIVPFYVAVQSVAEPLPGRPLLEKLGMNTVQMLLAASEKHSGSVDVATILTEEALAEGKISRLMSYEGIFHSDCAAEDEGYEDDSWLDLRIDTEEEIQDAFKNMMREAVDNGLSTGGAKEIGTQLNEYRDVFRLKLGLDPPALVQPMTVQLKPGLYLCVQRCGSTTNRNGLLLPDMLENWRNLRF